MRYNLSPSFFHEIYILRPEYNVIDRTEIKVSVSFGSWFIYHAQAIKKNCNQRSLHLLALELMVYNYLLYLKSLVVITFDCSKNVYYIFMNVSKTNYYSIELRHDS